MANNLYVQNQNPVTTVFQSGTLGSGPCPLPTLEAAFHGSVIKIVNMDENDTSWPIEPNAQAQNYVYYQGAPLSSFLNPAGNTVELIGVYGQPGWPNGWYAVSMGSINPFGS